MISVCIPVYNRDVRPLVRALVAQGNALDVEVEIICIDDCSTDDSPLLNAELKGLCRWVQLEENAEVSAQLKAVFDAKPNYYWIAIGRDDFLYQQNEGLRRYLDKKGYPYEYFESQGGHIWRNWRLYLSMFAQKLFR